MIQPAALSSSVATPRRAVPSQLASGGPFTLPEIAEAVVASANDGTPTIAGVEKPVGPASPMAGLVAPHPAAVIERHADAASGNELPPGLSAGPQDQRTRSPAPPAILVIQEGAGGETPPHGSAEDEIEPSSDRSADKDERDAAVAGSTVASTPILLPDLAIAATDPPPLPPSMANGSSIVSVDPRAISGGPPVSVTAASPPPPAGAETDASDAMVSAASQTIDPEAPSAVSPAVIEAPVALDPAPDFVSATRSVAMATSSILAGQTSMPMTASGSAGRPAGASPAPTSSGEGTRTLIATMIAPSMPALRDEGRLAVPFSPAASAIALPLHWQRPLIGNDAASGKGAAIATVPGAAPDATEATPVLPARTSTAVPPPPLAPPQATIAPAASGAAPAAVVFGAARFAAQVADDRDDPALPGVAPTLVAPAVLDRATAATATPTPLDLRQERWPHAMIERIEMIRDAAADAADAVDTRIRLIPDALGAIDVEVKRDGDTLNVRFHAEQAQTRTLLADAAPRLAEAAEARGLRLGQTSYGNGVGADAGSASQGQQRQPLPTAAPRAPVSTVADVPADDDTRLA